MREAQRAPSDREGRKPCSDTSLFQGLVVDAVFEDESGMNAKEVARGKRQRAVMLFKGTGVRDFFRPPSPPTQGGKRPWI